jgi:histone H3/H4
MNQGVFPLVKKRVFSLYDIEEFLRDAGAERVTEGAVISLERELQNTVDGLVREAAFYANYAGRKRTINASDVGLVNNTEPTRRHIAYRGRRVRASKKGNGGLKRSSAMKEILDPNKIRLVQSIS